MCWCHYCGRRIYLGYYAMAGNTVVVNRIIEPAFNEYLDSVTVEVEEPQYPTHIIARVILVHGDRFISLIAPEMLLDVLDAEVSKVRGRQDLLHPFHDLGSVAAHSERLVRISPLTLLSSDFAQPMTCCR